MEAVSLLRRQAKSGAKNCRRGKKVLLSHRVGQSLNEPPPMTRLWRQSRLKCTTKWSEQQPSLTQKVGKKESSIEQQLEKSCKEKEREREESWLLKLSKRFVCKKAESGHLPNERTFVLFHSFSRTSFNKWRLRLAWRKRSMVAIN